MRRLGDMRPDGTINMAVPLPMSSTGKVRRCCPNPECRPGLFLLGDGPETISDCESGMRRVPQSGGTTCPYCGTDGEDLDWLCPEDADHAHEHLVWASERGVVQDLQRISKRFNRELSGNPLGISIEIEDDNRPAPSTWIEDLLRELACNRCGRKYGVYAVGLFCPDCGGANLAAHFNREVELIGWQLDLAEGAEDRELGWRLLGNAHEDVLTALETHLKTVYRFTVLKRYDDEERYRFLKKGAGNVFQNQERAVACFAGLGIDIHGDLDDSERQLLEVYVSTRHVIGHNLGIVDQRFADATTDGQEGETVPLVVGDVRRFAALAMDIVAGLEVAIPELNQV